MRQFALTWVLAALAGCDPTAERDLADEPLDEARRAGVDYHGLQRRALQRDPQALVALLRLSERMDAAAALGHGCVLIEVADAVGDTALANACRPFSARARRHIFCGLRAGIDYGRAEDPDRFPVLFPLTAHALQGP